MSETLANLGDRWIITSRADWLLFLGAPLLLASFALFALRFELEAVILALGTIGTMGHHLPGFVRAYTDRGLFSAHWKKLIAAPVVFAVLCFFAVFAELNALTFVILIWGVWHAMAQVYGMGRVYDAKNGIISSRRARLDKLFCLSWFASVLLISPGRLRVILTELYKSGFPQVNSEIIIWIQQAAMAVTLIISIIWVAQLIQSQLKGQPQSLTKVLLYVGSIGFWWFANIPIQNAIIAVALFEILHDVHYLGFVWSFKNKETSREQKPSYLSKVLFQPGFIGPALFISLSILYGLFFRVNETILDGLALRILSVMILLSTLLHFYFDSFIWNLRNSSTRTVLTANFKSFETLPKNQVA